MEEGRSTFKILTGKRSLGRSTCRWEDNIRMDFKEMGINTRKWVDSAQDRDNRTARLKHSTSGFHN